VCPNSIDPIDKSVNPETRELIRKKYDIPADKKVFVYGGNLGKPQGIPFLIECLDKCKDIGDAFFLVVGDGTEYHLVEEYVRSNQRRNVRLMKRLPKEDYDTMVGACDIGLIFLDHRFTIPNFPSRLLSYMQARLPVLACTDPNTDIGKVITDGGFGRWCESNDTQDFKNLVTEFVKLGNEESTELKKNAFDYLADHFNTSSSAATIMKKISIPE